MGKKELIPRFSTAGTHQKEPSSFSY